MWFVPGPSVNGEENGRSPNPQKIEIADFAPKDTEETMPQLLKKVNKLLKEHPPSGNMVHQAEIVYCHDIANKVSRGNVKFSCLVVKDCLKIFLVLDLFYYFHTQGK